MDRDMISPSRTNNLNMANPQISVVIPLYNKAAWIGETLRSVLGQSFSDYEVVVVDDGSTDGSTEIAEEMLSPHQNARLIRQSNSGVSAARWRGVCESKGEWITFVDADDRLLPDDLKHLYQGAAADTNLVIGITFGRTFFKPQLSIEEYREIMREHPSEKVASAPWGKLFRRSVFTCFMFDLPRQFCYGEDWIMNLRFAIVNDKPVKMVNHNVYGYTEGTPDGLSSRLSASQDNFVMAWKEYARSFGIADFETESGEPRCLMEFLYYLVCHKVFLRVEIKRFMKRRHSQIEKRYFGSSSMVSRALLSRTSPLERVLPVMVRRLTDLFKN